MKRKKPAVTAGFYCMCCVSLSFKHFDKEFSCFLSFAGVRVFPERQVELR